MSAEGIPIAMQWQIKRLNVLQKETITMTPNKTHDVKPGQTIIVDLPYNSKVDLSSFSWFYDGSTTHNGSSGIDGPAGYVQSCFFPRNSASVIQKFTVKVNGGIKVDIPDYNFVYNMLHDYTQGADALKRRQTGGENSDPSNKLYITDGDIIERRLMFWVVVININYGFLIILSKVAALFLLIIKQPLRDFQYQLNHWIT